MRDSCLFCVRKHLSKALVLLSECQLGYPQHRDLVIGNMSEAEDEAVKKHPDLARAIREERLHYERDAGYCPDINQLLAMTRQRFPAGMSGVDGSDSKLSMVLLLGFAAFLLIKKEKR